MVIFHSYVSLPEGIDVDAPFGLFSRVSWFDQKNKKTSAFSLALPRLTRPVLLTVPPKVDHHRNLVGGDWNHGILWP
jgi:hypothetical protein